MNKAIFAVLAGLVGFIALVLVVAATSYISANNYGAATEAQLRAARDDNKNILAQYQQKVLEAVQVPEMYKNDLKEVVSAAMQGRYGADGSKAVFQWIKENNLTFDASVYKDITAIIAGGRKDFEVGQTRMIDIRRQYEAQLGYFWRGMWLRVAGFPKVDLKDFQPVTTDTVEASFKAGKESGPLKLR
jgi:type II secretory pathway pseudopilin PulG